MAERPIIFSADMVCAILAGRKSQTRRVVMRAWDGEAWAGAVLPAAESGWIAWSSGDSPNNLAKLAEFTRRAYKHGFPCPHGAPGDRLWVRESWWRTERSGLIYRADVPEADQRFQSWASPVYMPRWASRITLEITGVRVERLQDISEGDAIAEGVRCQADNTDPQNVAVYPPRVEFRNVWNSINARRGFGWNTNPWLWVIGFRKVQPHVRRGTEG